MTLNKREQKIALATGAILVVYLGYSYLISPYLDYRDHLAKNIVVAQAQLTKENALIKAQPKVAADWKAALGVNGAGVLKTAPAQAISVTEDALFTWARNARFDLPTIKPSAPRQEGDFMEIRFQLSGTGSTASTYLLLNAIETSDLPLKIEDLSINSRHNGTDDLAVTLNVSALIFSPPPATRPARSSNGESTL